MGDERVRESYAVFLVEGKPTNIVGVASPKLAFYFLLIVSGLRTEAGTDSS